MTDLTPEARAILDSGRDALAPSAATKAEVLAAVETSVASSAMGTGAGGLGSTKLILMLVLAVGIGGGIWLYSGEDPKQTPIAAQTPEPVAVPEPVAEPEPVPEAEPEPEPEPEPVPVPVPVPEPVPEPKLRRKAQPPAPSAFTLLAERKFIAAANRLIRAKKYKRAQTVLKQHRTEFPKGILAPERNAAFAIALCLGGQQAQGTSAANRFLRKNKNSPLAQRVKSACLP